MTIAKLRAACLLPFFCLFLLTASAQDNVPEFSVDIVSARGDGSPASSRVDVYARVGYRNLNFITTTNGFTAAYEMSLAAVETSDGTRLRNVVQSKIWDGNIVVPTYAETQSDNHSDVTTQSMDLPPGSYVFDFELTDKNSNQLYVQSIPAEVRSFDGPVNISDLTLIESYDAATFSVVPRVGKNISTSDSGFQLFYEIYANAPKAVTVRREVFRTVRDGGVPVAPAWMEISPTEDDVVGAVLSEDEEIALEAGKSQHVVSIPLDDIKAGAYVVRISLLDAQGSVIDSSEKAVAVQWSGLAAHIQNVDDAIHQLAIFVKKKEIDFILDAPTAMERVQRFESFWKKRDPTPNTKRNEAMEEFYYRVASANRQYGAVEEGWRTDRGYVFVNYGEPDHIERQPFNFDYEPYEVWTYERMGRRFIFVDKTGFGDYELLVPVWDERNRLY